jgi:hypothetical protein
MGGGAASIVGHAKAGTKCSGASLGALASELPAPHSQCIRVPIALPDIVMSIITVSGHRMRQQRRSAHSAATPPVWSFERWRANGVAPKASPEVGAADGAVTTPLKVECDGE